MGEILALLWIGLAGPVFAQGPSLENATQPVRIPVYHADPYLIVMLLNDQQPPYPEMSTLAIFGFMPQAQTGANTRLRGRFIVNPGDNSIWFLPDR
jgi:hypothetical protein